MIKILLKLRIKLMKTRYLNRVKNQCKSYKHPLKVNGKSYVTKTTVLGSNVNFNGISISGRGRVEIGDNFHSATGCRLLTDIHNYEGQKIPYDSSIISKDILIEDNVWLGESVMVLGGVTIGEGAIIQAGSVVVNDIPKYAIAGGHPARVFSQRDKVHYESLKKQGQFH